MLEKRRTIDAKENQRLKPLLCSTSKIQVKTWNNPHKPSRKIFRVFDGFRRFSKKRLDLGTRLLVESMVLPEEGSVLDVGCGYGAVGIAAAVFNPNLRVVLVDVNERAIWLAKQNIEVNRVGNAEVRQGHLYEPVSGLSFNSVLSNPPVSAGLETVKAIITGAPKHMISKALFQMVVRSKVGGKRLCNILEEAFGNVGVLARKSGYRVLVSEKQ